MCKIIKSEGFGVLFRGLPAVLSAAIPSHAAYFGAYEFAKEKFDAYEHNEFHVARVAAAGTIATCG